jgi:desulfoferrodoxin (superoxide reductase-like protein)
MIPDLQSSILCDDVRQERNGKFILIGLFDAIAAQRFPVRYPRLFMVTRWCSGQGDFTQRTRILEPDQSTVLLEGKHIPVRLTSAEATATNVEVFVNVSFEKEGTHWIEVLLDEDLKLRYPLRVNKVTKKSRPPTSG